MVPPLRLALMTASLVLFPGAGAVVAHPSTDAATDAAQRWHFRVLLDGEAVGWHDIQVVRTPDGVDVEGHARFTVRWLGIPVYRYEHWDSERWASGCLRSISARTDDNGRALAVEGSRSDSVLRIGGPSGSLVEDGCVSSYAYWDPSMLGRDRLLNAQTGALDRVTIARVGEDELLVGAQRRPAVHYALTSAALHIELWYSPAGDWLGLESRTPQGRTLRYELAP